MLACNPVDVIGEVLGVRAFKGVSPSSENFRCPFIQRQCVKRSAKLEDEPYPVCSIFRAQKTVRELIPVCPKRFYAVDFLTEVIEHCWPGDAPKNPRFAPEVKMAGFGNVDFVIADVSDDDEIANFLSVELQAIDITGSAFPLYEALRDGVDYDGKKRPGFNWDNVYKRYVTQLIRKGYFHHHWKSKIVAVIPEQVFEYIKNKASFMTSSDVKTPDVNIIFMTYSLEPSDSDGSVFKPVLRRVEGTSHSNLQNAILYKDPPSKAEFAARVQTSLSRANNLADLLKGVESSPLEVDIEVGGTT